MSEVRKQPELDALHEHIRQLEAKVKELSAVDWWNDWEDPEYSFGCWSEAVDDLDVDDVRRVIGCRQVSEKWAAHFCVSVDEDGEPDETEARLFDTKVEAEKCWDESLAAARSTLETAPTEVRTQSEDVST